MSLRYHGNWCGPGWSAGQYKDAKDLSEEDLNVPAIDALDEVCKAHDIDLRNAYTRADVEAANARFFQRAKLFGIKGVAAAVAVGLFGPKEPHTYSDHARLMERIADGPVHPRSAAARSMRSFREQAFPCKSFLNFLHGARNKSQRFYTRCIRRICN